MSWNLSEDRGGADGASEEELAARITSALKARAAVSPDPAVVAARIDARLATMPERSALATATRRSGKVVAAGVVTSALAVAGAGAAAAANPYSDVTRTVETLVQAVGIEWSAMPPGYTREQYDALWGAGYTQDDVTALGALWQTDTVETKSRAGQLILDGRPVPVPPGGAGVATAPQIPLAERQAALEAFFDAGYGWEDAEALGELWDADPEETKVLGGQALLEGRPLPFGPGDGEPDG